MRMQLVRRTATGDSLESFVGERRRGRTVQPRYVLRYVERPAFCAKFLLYMEPVEITAEMRR